MLKQILWLLAAYCLLLASCSEPKSEEPTPSLRTDQQSTSALQELFTQRQYDRLVNAVPTAGTSTLKWVPQWQATIWKTGAKRSAYVPLLAQSATPGDPAKTGRNVMKYIRFQQEDGQWHGTLFSCYSKLPQGDISQLTPSTLTGSLLRNFTGDVFTQNLETSNTLHSTYEQGVWQNPNLAVGKGKDQIQALGCVDYYICEWFVYCSDGSAGGGSYTSVSQGGCDKPFFQLSCGYDTQYSPGQQYLDYSVCGDPENPDPNPYPGDGPPAPTVVESGVYGIYDAQNFPNKVMAVLSGSTTANATVVTDHNWGGSKRTWIVERGIDGYYFIMALHSYQYLEIQEGTGVAIQAPYTGRAAQQFEIASVGNGRFTIRGRNSNKVLEVQGGWDWPGVSIVQNDYWGGHNQQWYFRPSY